MPVAQARAFLTSKLIVLGVVLLTFVTHQPVGGVPQLWNCRDV